MAGECFKHFVVKFAWYTFQVKSGTIFDNVLITDDEDLASSFAEETFSVTKDGEKKMKEQVRCDLQASA